MPANDTNTSTAVSASPVPRPLTPGTIAGVAVVMVAFVLLAPFAFGERTGSGDLLGLWIAGQAFAEGQFGAIYPPDATVFRMLPPPEWQSLAAEQNADFAVFPFLYAPLWAWLSGWLGRITDFATFQAVLTYLNPALIVATVFLAGRAAAPHMNPVVYCFAGTAVMGVSTVGSIAILSNHLQIAVAFLTVFAVERSMAGRPKAAGAALALAAAMKLYPALYAVFLFARGDRSALASFTAVGGALAGLSVAVGGWPLHAEFLRLLGVLGDTALLTIINFSAETTIGQILYPGRIVAIRSDWGPPVGWHILPKPEAFSLALQTTAAIALVALAVSFARARGRPGAVFLWPAAMAILSVLGPIAWCYYYIAPAAFLPALIERFGPARGLPTVLLFAGLTSPLFPLLGLAIPGALAGFAIVGTLAVCGMAWAFWRASRPGRTA